MGDDRSYMMQAIDLARRAEGFTTPNPMVGCVLVKNGHVIAEGYHACAGTAHAEAAALQTAGDAAQGATAYVTLEPCNHHGQNPPCSEALIDAGVAEVIYAVADPNPLAKGGADKLRTAGIKVRTEVCSEEAQHLIRFWLHRMRTGRPYVVAKFAASLDGKIATRTGDSKWITSEAARLRGHDLRQMCDAIIVGVDTIIADDPGLTARPAGIVDAAHPLRVVLDTSGRMPADARVLSPDAQGDTLIATTDAMALQTEQALERAGAEVLRLRSDKNGRPCVISLLRALAKRNLISCMIEGGSTVHGSFFDQRLVKEVWSFLAPVIIGGDGPSPVGGYGPGKIADAFRLQNCAMELLGDDILLRGQISDQDVTTADGTMIEGGAA